jgi:hypothetical protein
VHHLLQLLFTWWDGKDGGTKTADAADKYVLPVLLLVSFGCLIAVAAYFVWR